MSQENEGLGSQRGVKAAPCRPQGPGPLGEGTQNLTLFLLHPGWGVRAAPVSELALPQGPPESPHPPRAWAPVGPAGEAGAEHLPIGLAPAS